MSNTKIRIKVGDVEVDYEGDSAYLKSDLLKLIKELQGADGATTATRTSADKKSRAPAVDGQLTTKSIAAKLNASSASELAKAALAHLVIIKGKDQVGRNEILAEMKSATGHYKASMTSNHTKTMGILLKEDAVVENSKDVYSLKPAAEEKLRSALVGG